MTLLASGALEIAHVQVSDAGQYKCNISNIASFKISSEATLIADPSVSGVSGEFPNIAAPQVIANPKDTVALEGSNLTLDCVANGFPQPNIIWLKDGTSIDMSLEKDSGTYMCRAENHEDSVDNIAVVTVQVPPQFLKKPDNKIAIERDDLEFECMVHGKPFPDLRWYKNGDLLFAGDYFQISNQGSLKILGALEADSGFYQCIASNEAGNVQAHAQLVVRPPGGSHHLDQPGPPQKLEAAIVSTRFVTLSWKPPEGADDILVYSVYFREEGSTRQVPCLSRERVVNTTRSRLEEASIQGLTPATRYVFRIVAYNHHGPGVSSKELQLVTQAEVDVPGQPSDFQVTAVSPTSIYARWNPPKGSAVQGYRLYYVEAGSGEEHQISTSDPSYLLKGLKKYADYQSVIIRWEPPPKDSQNGIITGYKIRYKLKGSRRGETVTTDGNRRLYTLTNLNRGAQYSIKMAAMTVNGSGPATEWMTKDTFQNDLDETRVPEQPTSLRVRPSAKSIYVSWAPPSNPSIMTRGYTIGYGIGFPDVYTKVLDGKQREYTIENLRMYFPPLLLLLAHHAAGLLQSLPRTIVAAPEPLTPMLPPVGLKAIVLSATTVVLYWTDSTLPRTQVVTDGRYYTVRYTAAHRHRYHNSTDLNCMIAELKPNTLYEFSVKVIKGRRESTWSMSVFNTTHEAAPSSPPRDLTVVPSADNPTMVNLHWQPPKQPNGQITGYVILYTDNIHLRDRDWAVLPIVGDKMTAAVKDLNPDSVYYFKVNARNSKGYGPLSTPTTIKTSPAGYGNPLFFGMVGLGALLVVLIIVVPSFIICRRRRPRSTR
ncbi:NEO1, partial [Cordylochernes scorpioides]